MYKIIAKTKELSREEWLKLRTNGIGGSDVSIIAGMNPFKSVYELWLEKTGQKEPEQTDSEYAHFGTLLEPVVRKEFTDRTGIKVRQKHMLLQSVRYPWMYADLDGVINQNGELAIFEAKTASAYKEEIWEEGVPAEYLLQVQHYMCVTGAKRTYIAALVGGNHFFYHVIERDDDMIAMIVAIENAFWQTNVKDGIEPVPDGSYATTNYFNKRFSVSNGETVTLPDEALIICEEYDKISEQLKELERKKSETANKLKNYLKEAEQGIVGTRVVSWKPVVKNTIDSKKLKAEHPEIYSSYLKESSYRRLSVA